MRLKDFIEDKFSYIISIFVAIISYEILFIPFEFPLYIKIYAGLIPMVAFLICFFVEYYIKSSYYNNIKEKLEELEEAYLITEVIDKPDFLEGKLLEDILVEISKSMYENVAKYKYLQNDYKEYIELWIHEIKLPIATGKMIVENNKSEITESINEELDKIDNYTEQALFYARSNTVEKDYYIKKVSLKEVINSVIIKNKRSLIQNNISIDTDNLDVKVYTDMKWCSFILNQILQNSIKYAKDDNKKIEIYAKENREKVELCINDNGIGIKASELSRVFDKGFTGENGRKKGQKATGIGLYLCKKLCDKLNLGLELSSEENEYTEVTISFPKNSFLEEVVGK